MSDSKKQGLDEGGAKQQDRLFADDTVNPELEHESKQKLKNSGRAKPEDYPDRSVNPV
ncbi:hypothetical protein GCM10011371_08740 [Novosphingobium marinum]|uniref:Uncharacterized protein n=1 Tax=Novosphingobium marinum TaxID=1514948 RepID=A0A7Y9XU96_9SPHN|nr:hypothetical protein [Novosphingobium marinum]NYH94562.1 hypothetical protein [Novosphingobium marinum]GGC23282.1 hypothetical protein GCM10011371_08740 [Novosphingobium marinum]